jgi:hypothetical protein
MALSWGPQALLLYNDAYSRLLEETTPRVLAGCRRRLSEERLRRSAAREAYLLHLSDALRSLSDPVLVMAEASRVLGEHLEATRVMYGEVSADGMELIVERNHVAEDAPS